MDGKGSSSQMRRRIRGCGRQMRSKLFFFYALLHGFSFSMALVSQSDLDGGIHPFFVWDSLRLHSKQQNNQWEIHEYIDLLNFVCLNAFIACSILYV